MIRKEPSLPKDPIENVLLKSRRRCAFCYISGDTQPKDGNIAHIQPVSEDSLETPDNLVYLCQMHFAEFRNQKESGGILLEGIRAARSKLYQAVENEPALKSSSKPRVIFVCGNDSWAKEVVLQYLVSLGLEPIILFEQPSLGRTIIEQLESYIADVQYAIVLLSADEQLLDIRKKEKRFGRSRQNVVLELGYFLGRLGRNRVCVLYTQNVEIPSDYHGTQYILMDRSGSWKRLLTRELEVGLVLPVKNSA